MALVKSARIYSGVVRVVTFLVWIFLLADVLPLYDNIKKYPGINGTPYSPTIQVSLAAASASGASGCIWVFFTWIPAWFSEGFCALVIFCIDLFITICLFITVVLSPIWMLLTKSECASHNLTTYEVPEGYPSVYVIGSGMPLSNSSVEVFAEQVCVQFVQIWNIAIALFILWSLASACQLYVGIHKTFEWPWPSRELPYSASRRERFTHLIIFTITFPPKLTIALMPKKVHAWTWFLYRACCKAIQGLKSALSLPQLQKAKSKRTTTLTLATSVSTPTPSPFPISSEKPPPQPNTTAEATLARLLYWDILLLLARHLHYGDIIALSQTSRSIRHAILPPADHAARIALLTRYTLDVGSSRRCDVCGVPACDLCRWYKRLSPSWQDHVNLCEPWCTRCYMKDGNYDAGTREWCGCNVVEGNALCRSCFARGDEDLAKDRDARLERVLKRRSRVERACGKCGGALGWGPRWWICSECRKECGCRWHGGWGGRGRKEESAV